MNPANYLYLSALLFTIGASGVLLRRNAIVMFMCVELMLNAVNLAFVTFARMHGSLDGQMIAFTPHTTNAATVTLNVDGLGAKPLRSALAGRCGLIVRKRNCAGRTAFISTNGPQ